MRTLWIGLALWHGTVPASGAAAEATETTAAPESVTIDAVLRGIDSNHAFKTRSATMKLSVQTDKRRREYKLRTYTQGPDAAVEFLAPARDKGTKMLQRGGEVWVSTEGTEVKNVVGEGLLEGVMSSDLSYLDLLSREPLAGRYSGKIKSSVFPDGRACWILDLTATNPGDRYARRVMWVDRETHVPLKQELYAPTGMLSKTWDSSDVREVGGHQVPMQMTIQSHVLQDTMTTVDFSDVSFDVELEEGTFEPAWLR